MNPTVIDPTARPARDDAARPISRVEGVVHRFAEPPRLSVHSVSHSAPRRSDPGDPSSAAGAPIARGCRRAAASIPRPDQPVEVSRRGATRPTEIVGTGKVRVSPALVFTFLEDLENHRLLTGGAVAIEELDGPPGARTGSRVQLRGPLGIRRRARTRMLDSRAPAWMIGSAEIGRGTLAMISWTITEDSTGSCVRLKAEIARLGVPDRVLLALGGRRWLRRLLEESVTALAERLAPPERPSPQAAGLALGAPAPVHEPALAWEGR
jgi:hypothetical protein